MQLEFFISTIKKKKRQLKVEIAKLSDVVGWGDVAPTEEPKSRSQQKKSKSLV
jgi:hypothetical protein